MTVMRSLEAAGIKVVPTGLKHGTVTAIANSRVFELTTLRRDVETDGRRAVVAFTDDWLEDASRRDFTFNALYADPDGTLYDPFDGRADLAAGRVRFIGDPDTRIAEEAIRRVEDADRFLGDARVGIADEAHPARGEIGAAVERVVQRAVGIGVKRVEGEVAAAGVFEPVVGEGDDRAPPVGLDVAPQGRELEDPGIGDRRHRAMLQSRSERP